eukprot:6337875-Alexandrium_andersonii.AAC.1
MCIRDSSSRWGPPRTGGCSGNAVALGGLGGVFKRPCRGRRLSSVLRACEWGQLRAKNLVVLANAWVGSPTHLGPARPPEQHRCSPGLR